VGHFGLQNEEIIKNPAAPRDCNLRAEKDIRLRIDLLEGQSSSIAKMLEKAIRDHNEAAFREYAERLAANRNKIEELLWVLGEKVGQSVLDLQIAGPNSNLSVKEVIDKLRAGELKMDHLSPDAQAKGRKGALELKTRYDA
jgi:hypothetical protein